MPITLSTLSNGLRVASDTMADAGSVTLGVWIDVGTRDEPQNAHGLAHLVEHMLFKGTTRRSAYELSVAIENVGGFMNAYTSREETAYHARVLPEDAELACDVLADMLLNSSFPEHELDRERSVIIQEIGQYHDTPEEHIFDILQTSVYPDQAFGRSILGTEEAIAAMPRQTLVNYVKSHYQAPRMIMAAAGTIDHGQLVHLAEKYFSGLSRGLEAPPRLHPSYTRGNSTEKRELEQQHVVIAMPGVGLRDSDYVAVQMLMTMLGGGASSRLFQEVRENRGLAYTVGAGNQAGRDTGLITVYAGTAPEKETELLTVIKDELAKMTQTISADELGRARAQLRAALLMAQESSSTRAEQLAGHLLVYGRPLTIEERVIELDAVTQDGLKVLAAKLLTDPALLSTIRLGPV